LQLPDFQCKVLIRFHQSAQGYKGAHDSNVGFNGTRLLRMPLSMATPCSVKAKGGYLECFPPPFFKDAICDLNELHSSGVSSNIKSSGKRAMFHLTASFKRLFLLRRLMSKS
jgi:hypothetical protein